MSFIVPLFLDVHLQPSSPEQHSICPYLELNSDPTRLKYERRNRQKLKAISVLTRGQETSLNDSTGTKYKVKQPHYWPGQTLRVPGR
jgi:hypothetical protein